MKLPETFFLFFIAVKWILTCGSETCRRQIISRFWEAKSSWEMDHLLDLNHYAAFKWILHSVLFNIRFFVCFCLALFIIKMREICIPFNPGLALFSSFSLRTDCQCFKNIICWWIFLYSFSHICGNKIWIYFNNKCSFLCGILCSFPHLYLKTLHSFPW